MHPTSMRRLRALHRDERGSALMAVLGVMAVTAIVGMTLTAASINALSVTSSTRASVQSLAAAEAGIDVALTALRTTDGCTTVGEEGALVFTPVDGVPIKKILIKPDNKIGCPDINSSSVQITSTGLAGNSSIAGATSGDEATVQEVYSYDQIVVQVPMAGVAVYAYKVDGVLKKFVLSSGDNSVATSVMIKTGDVECTNNASIGGDLVLGDGSAKLDMCDVAGSVHVSKDAVVNKSKIGQDVKASGIATVTNSVVSGSIQAGPAVPAPIVPGWVDVGFDPLTWTARGYNVVNWTGSCAISKASTEWANIKNHTSKTVINFLSKCPLTAVTTSNNMDYVALSADIVFVAKEFKFDRLYFSAAAARQVSFIVPDDLPNGAPTCVPPPLLTGGITLSNEADFGSNIAAMIYTPCKVRSDRNGFRGQIYGGEVEFGQQAQLVFVPVGIAGVDLTEGITVPKISGAALGEFLSRREMVSVG